MNSEEITKALMQNRAGLAGAAEGLQSISNQLLDGFGGPSRKLSALMAQLAEEQRVWRSPFDEVMKRFQVGKILLQDQGLGGFESLAKKMAEQQKAFQDPLSEFMKQMDRIQSSRFGMFEHFDKMQSIALNDSFSHIRSLQRAFDASSIKLVSEAISSNRVDILENINDITSVQLK